MKKVLLAGYTLFLAALMSAQTPSNIIPHHAVVRFVPSVLEMDVINNPEIRTGQLQEVVLPEFVTELDKILQLSTSCATFKFHKITRLTEKDSISTSRRGTKVYVPAFWAVLDLEVPKTDSLELVLERLKQCPSIIYAHPDFKVEFYGANDPLYSSQTNLQPSVFPEGMINVDSAWTLETGKDFIKIGISDSGFDTTHEDLSLYFGDVYGFDPAGSFQYWYQDYNNHGTKCASIIGAPRNNGLGVAGIAGGDSTTSGVRMYGMAITSLPSGSWAVATLIEGAYSSGANTALTNWPGESQNMLNYGFGLHAMNCSWGIRADIKIGEDDGNSEITLLNCDICYEALEFVYRNEMIVVASRGNTTAPYDSTSSFPATFSIDEAVINVGGSGLDGHYYNPNTNGPVINSGRMPRVGKRIDIIAPYSDTMIHTVSAKGDYTNLQNNLYEGFGGTSASAPQVTGIVALMLSFYNVPNCSSSGNLAPEDVEYILERTATDKGTTNAAPPLFNLGYDLHTGYGLVNGYQALKAIEKPQYQIFHSDDSLIQEIEVIQVASDTLICMETPYSGYGPLSSSITVLDGSYFGDIYKVRVTYDHSSWTSSPTDTILDLWSRPSDSEGWGFYAGHVDSLAFPSPLVLCNNIKTRPIAYVESFDENHAVLSAYYYHFKQEYGSTTTMDNWLPVDTNHVQLAYSLYSYDPNRTTNVGFDCDSATIYPVGTNKIITDPFQLLIIPNPSNGLFEIRSNTYYDQLILYDLAGKIIHREKFDNFTTRSTINQPLSKGIYLIQILNRNHFIASSKISIQ